MESIAAIDIGYSNLKVMWRGLDGIVRKALRPSGAAPLSDMPSQGSSADLCGGTLVELPSGEGWVAGVSHRAPQETARVLDASYPHSDAYLANFLAGLSLTRLTQIDHLVTGLPVTNFYQGERGGAASLRTRLMGTHRIGPNHEVTVKDVNVLPQPVGACLATAGEIDDLKSMTKRILVLDPGFYSFDFVVIDGLAVRHKSSGSSMHASSTVLASAAAAMARDTATKISRETLEQMIQRGEVLATIPGRGIDVQSYLDVSARTVARQVANEVLASLRAEVDGFDAIVLAGGGASMFLKHLAPLFAPTPIFVPRDPVMANAIGYFLFATS